MNSITDLWICVSQGRVTSDYLFLFSQPPSENVQLDQVKIACLIQKKVSPWCTVLIHVYLGSKFCPVLETTGFRRLLCSMSVLQVKTVHLLDVFQSLMFSRIWNHVLLLIIFYSGTFLIINTEGLKKMYTHFNVQNICLNKLLVYLRFNFENAHR
jgi:hypothetical protein